MKYDYSRTGKTKEQVKEFLLKTLLPYKEDPSICGFDKDTNRCVYLTKDGRKCAFGKWMEYPEGYKGSGASACGLIENIKVELKKEAKDFHIPGDIWNKIQRYHDKLARGQIGLVNSTLDDLELIFDVDLPELTV